MSFRDDNDRLFCKGDLSETLRQHYGKVKDIVAGIPEKQFLVTSDTELLTRVESDLLVLPIELDESASTMKREEIKIDVSQYPDRNIFGNRGPIYVAGFKLLITIPFQGDLLLWQLRPNQWQSTFPRGRVKGVTNQPSGVLEVTYQYPADVGPEKTKGRHDENLRDIRFYLANQKNQIVSEQSRLGPLIQKVIGERRERLKGHDERLTELFGIPVRPSQESVQDIDRLQRAPNASNKPATSAVGVDEKWDVFISHASDDKEDIARPLADALRQRGIKVWFDEFTLKVGDSLRRSIDKGLARSRYGIVIISPAFLEREWPQKELDGLVAREIDGHKVILPVWHSIDAIDLRRRSPMLADRLATNSTKGLDQVVADLLAAIQ